MKKIIKKIKSLFKRKEELLVCDMAYMPDGFTLEMWEKYARKHRIIVKDSSRHNYKHKN